MTLHTTTIIGEVGNWTSEGCETEEVSEDVVRCLCNHLTNFACLVVSLAAVSSTHTANLGEYPSITIVPHRYKY